MIENKGDFLNFIEEKGGNVYFGYNVSFNIIGKGMVSLGNKRNKEDNVLLVDNMKHYLLSMSQMCDQGHTLTFDSERCKIKYRDTGSLVATATKTSNNV